MVAEPSFVHQAECTDRSAQVIQIDSSKHVATVAICAVVSGVCLMASIACACIAWNTSTDFLITRNRLVALQAQHDVLVHHVEELDDAIRSK